ncbi:hypothetical protein [Lysobacter gummosus]|uniref:hypothetical protein n=1 Tax=Lysobacter gummosus TaxID=262324 RepID=UPI00362C0DA4
MRKTGNCNWCPCTSCKPSARRRVANTGRTATIRSSNCVPPAPPRCRRRAGIC